MKTAVITGGNRGLGLACARTILNDPAWRVVFACRDIAAAQAAAQTLPAGPDRVVLRQLDLGALASIRSFAAGPLGPIDALVCNAGIQHVAPGIARTADGFEASFGINYLGHFLLANLLLPQLARPSRIVFVSSGTHDPAQKTGLPAPLYTSARELALPSAASGDPFETGRRRYTTSKLCLIYCTYEMQRRLRAAGIDDITVNAMDPGMMPGTGLARDYPGWMRWGWSYILPLTKLFMHNVNTPATSGAHLAHLAIAPRYAGIGGQYFEGETPIRSSDLSYNTENARELWQESWVLTGETKGLLF